MYWDLIAIAVGGALWWWMSARATRSAAREAAGRLRAGVGRGLRARGPIARLVALGVLLFALRWATILAHYGASDGLRVLTGEALLVDEEGCQAHQAVVRNRLLAAIAKGDAVGHRGGRAQGGRARCPTSNRTLRFDLLGRLHCSVHGRDEDLRPVLQ